MAAGRALNRNRAGAKRLTRLASMKAMTGKEVTTYDEEKMRKRWKEFWAEADAVDGE
jgi:hypothetical protein